MENRQLPHPDATSPLDNGNDIYDDVLSDTASDTSSIEERNFKHELVLIDEFDAL